MLSNKDYQIVVIQNPYDEFESNNFVRTILSNTWGMKLKGYKRYFPYGVLPNDHLDFIANHIIVCKKKYSELIPVMGIKNITPSCCKEFRIDFPIYQHLFKGREKEFDQHISAVKDWVDSKKEEEVAYSMGFTVDPDLEKNEKKELLSFNWNLFYFYYTTYNIPNVIHGISKTFKLDEVQHEMGFKMLKFQGKELDYIETKAYNNVQSYLMVLENNNFKKEFIAKSEHYRNLWETRIEINRHDSLKKIAA